MILIHPMNQNQNSKNSIQQHIRPTHKKLGKSFHMNFRQIDPTNMQLNMLYAYSNNQFIQIMLKIKLPKFLSPKISCLHLCSDTIVGDYLGPKIIKQA